MPHFLRDGYIRYEEPDMTKPVAYQAVIQGGPLAAQKTRVHTSPRLPAEGGFYVWMANKGPTPATWRWVPEKKDVKK